MGRIFHHYADVKSPISIYPVQYPLIFVCAGVQFVPASNNFSDCRQSAPGSTNLRFSSECSSLFLNFFVLHCDLPPVSIFNKRPPVAESQIRIISPLPLLPPKKTEDVLHHYRRAAILSHTMLKRNQLNFSSTNSYRVNIFSDAYNLIVLIEEIKSMEFIWRYLN